MPKALWIKENEPEVFEAATTICEYQVGAGMCEGWVRGGQDIRGGAGKLVGCAHSGGNGSRYKGSTSFTLHHSSEHLVPGFMNLRPCPSPVIRESSRPGITKPLLT